MNIIYSFIGILPEYILYTVYQSRLYFNGNIYLITDDLNSEYIKILVEKYNVIIIDYNNVKDEEFITAFNNYKINWEAPYLEHLKNREFLFIRSYERLFLVNNLIKMLNLENVLTLEIDNLIYSNPELLIENFKETGDLTAMASFDLHYCIGYMYIKNNIDNLIKFMLDFIIDQENIYRTQYGKITEMKALNAYHIKYKLGILPVYYNNGIINNECYENYDKFNNTIFDGLGHGVNLLGRDKIHTNPMDFLYIKENDENNIYKWEIDIDGNNKPYLFNKSENNWLLIHNLHVHSKELEKGLSKPYKYE
jgi:hypothetical protein